MNPAIIAAVLNVVRSLTTRALQSVARYVTTRTLTQMINLTTRSVLTFQRIRSLRSMMNTALDDAYRAMGTYIDEYVASKRGSTASLEWKLNMLNLLAMHVSATLIKAAETSWTKNGKTDYSMKLIDFLTHRHDAIVLRVLRLVDNIEMDFNDDSVDQFNNYERLKDLYIQSVVEEVKFAASIPSHVIKAGFDSIVISAVDVLLKSKAGITTDIATSLIEMLQVDRKSLGRQLEMLFPPALSGIIASRTAALSKSFSYSILEMDPDKLVKNIITAQKNVDAIFSEALNTVFTEAYQQHVRSGTSAQFSSEEIWDMSALANETIALILGLSKLTEANPAQANTFDVFRKHTIDSVSPVIHMNLAGRSIFTPGDLIPKEQKQISIRPWVPKTVSDYFQEVYAEKHFPEVLNKWEKRNKYKHIKMRNELEGLSDDDSFEDYD